MRSNWRGVAMCLSAALRVPELEAVRARFLTASPGAEARGRMLLMTANGFEADGKIADAIRNCELVLGVDPLNLELHHKRHALLKSPPRTLSLASQRSSRKARGEQPTSRRNAALNALSDSYPILNASSPMARSVVLSASFASSILH